MNIEELEKKLKHNIPARDDRSVQPGGHKPCPHGNDLRTFSLGGWPCPKCLRDLQLAIGEYLNSYPGPLDYPTLEWAGKSIETRD